MSQSFYHLINAIYLLFPSGLDTEPASKDWKDICNERFRSAKERYNDAASQLGGNAPFINGELYEKYQYIMMLARQQINDYSFSEPLEIYKSSPSIDQIVQRGHNRTQEVDEKWKELLDSLREYFASLTDE